MPLTLQDSRFSRALLVSSVAIFLFFAAGERVSAACTPCTFSYTLEVEYHLGGRLGTQVRILSGTAQVFDGTLDLDLGSVEGLLRQLASDAALDRVKSVTLGTAAGASASKSDVLLASDGNVVLWVEAFNSSAARLHASTTSALEAQHAFSFTVTARGTESPPVDFSFLIAALGDENYPKPTRHEESVAIAHFGTNGDADCREISGDACLPLGCTTTASNLVDLSVGGLLSRKFVANGDRCAHFEIKATSTSSWTTLNCNGAITGCWNCGGWYQGTAVLDGLCATKRPWGRKATGTGTVTGPVGPTPGIDFLITYAQAGGVLGSGLPDAGDRVGMTSFLADILDCQVGGVAVSCKFVHFGMQGDTLRASTDYARPVEDVSQGTGSLSAPEGIVFFGAFPFTAPNNDVDYVLQVTFAGKTYSDLNDDRFVDVGPFSLWMAGDKLWGAFDRSSVPTAVIDSIAPNPALAGQPVSFAGHGIGGTISGYEWFTHRLAQPGPDGPLLSKMRLFTRNDLLPGRHQIRFHVLGANTSPFVFAALTINQPPVAFINHVENAVDPAHPAVSLVLQGEAGRRGLQSDPFRFDGGGIDFDGSVVAYEWTSDGQAGVLSNSPRFEASLAVLGTHKISLRVRDDQGAWSAPVTTTVTVRRPPVLLVHGFCGGYDTWDDLVEDGLLKPEWQGGDIVRRRFDPNGDRLTNDSPSDIAQEVAAEIQDMKSRFGVRTVNVVVHSMGGLATRSYIQGPGFQGDVHRLAMLGTPNHGANIADLILIAQGYSEQDVELSIPVPGAKELLRSIGLIVDINLFNIGLLLECQATDSPAAHDLRPHSDFVRNLNRTFKDEGTEDFGASGQPDDKKSSFTQYFTIAGMGKAVSHTHLPSWIKDLIFAATAGQVNLSHMELVWLRSGDTTVTERSLHLDDVPKATFDHWHTTLTGSRDSVGAARSFLVNGAVVRPRVNLLDDPPTPSSEPPRLDQIEGAQLLGASQGSFLPSFLQDLQVDGAATRLRVHLSWEDANARVSAAGEDVERGGGIRLLLTSPSGTIYDTTSPAPGLVVVRDGASLNATIARPAPGTWSVQVDSSGTALAYRWLAHQESGTFLAIGLSTHRTDPGQPVKLAAYVQSEGAGVTGASVYAAVAPPAGKPVSLAMVEDSRFPGLYVTDFTPQVEGAYKVLASASLQAPQGGAPVTRSGITSFDARSLAELSITTSLSNPAPQNGEPVRWFATVRNAGAAGASATVVQFFDGLPAAGGRLVGTRTIDLPPGPAEAQTSILWLARTGEHRLVAVVDPMNRGGEADVTRHVAEIQATAVDRTPPVARAGADQVAAIGQNVFVDGRASTDDDRIVRYDWWYFDAAGGLVGILQGPYVALPGGFRVPGTYTVVLTVMDASGNRDSAQLTVRVIEDFDTVPPIADAGLELGAVVGAPVTFDGTRSRDDFGIARATWDVDVTSDSDGDGNRGNDQDLAGLSPTFAAGYPRPGLFLARLTVSDSAGNDPSTSTVLVRVIQAADDCMVTVPPGGDINRALELATPGETVCLRPALYHTSGIVISSPGVTLDGQGAVLDSTVGTGVILFTPRGAATPSGVAVRHLTVRNCSVGFAIGEGTHHLSDNAVQNCQAGFIVESLARKSVLERNRVEHSGFGFLVHGIGNRLVNNSARDGGIGFQVFSGRLEGNQACNNRSDLVGGLLDLRARLSSGADNACGVALSWSDDRHHGCTFSCNQIRIPSNGLFVDQDTLFEAGSYSLTSGLVVSGRNVHVRFSGTELLGPQGVAIPGIELRDAPGASLTGGTIAGFGRGLRVERSDGVQISGIEIRDAEVGIEVESSGQGKLSNVRVTSGDLALRLDASTRDWTVGQSDLSGEGGGAFLGGSGHSLRDNHLTGGVTLTETTGSHLIGNVIVSRREGISLISSESTEIRRNTVTGDTVGILVRDSLAAKITDNVVSGHRGILLDGGADLQVAGNQVEAIVAGIHLRGGRNDRILGNALAARRGPAIVLELAAGNEIASNDATSSMQGIDLHSSDSNRIRDNRLLTRGLLPGIALAGSKGNVISNNVLTDLWSGGVLALASNSNQIAGNELHASGAAPREILTLGIGLVEQLQNAPGIPARDLAKGLSFAWESLRSFAGLDRITVEKSARFFDRLAAAMGIFQKLATEPRTLPEERGLLEVAAAQMARGAELVVRQTIRDARGAGLDEAMLQLARRRLLRGIRLAAAGRGDLAIDSFGQAWAAVGAAAASPARLAATLTVAGEFTEGGEVIYTASLTNIGPRTQRDNPGDEFFDRLPAEVDLNDVVANTGQASADRASRSVSWNGSIPSGASVTLTIRATIRLGTARKTVTNQGTVKFDEHGDGLNEGLASTDDPGLPGPADATRFTVRGAEPSPLEIPTLSPAALLILISLLAVAAVVALWRQPPAKLHR